MSGKAPTEKGPQAPKVFKQSKFPVKLKLEKVEQPQDAALTIITSSQPAKPEDQGPPPQYSNIAQVSGMFRSAKPKAPLGSAAPGLDKPKPVKKEKQERNLTRALALNFDRDENEEEEEEDETVPTPPPLQVAQPTVKKTEAEPQLPPIAKEYLGMTKPAKKAYDEASVKKRMTTSIAKTLIDLGEQLEGLDIIDINFDTLQGVTEEKVDGVTKYTFGQNFEENANVNEEKLAALDDLFETLRIRMDSLSGEGTLDKTTGKEPTQLLKDYEMLKKLIAFAPKFDEQKEKKNTKLREDVTYDLMTPEIADTLLEIEDTLSNLEEFGLGFETMTEKAPAAAGQPYVYEFDDGNSFIIVDDSEEEKAKVEARIAQLNPLLPNGSKLTLYTITGMGKFDEAGTPLQKDIEFLKTTLFKLAKNFKAKGPKVVATAKVQAEEEAVKTLEGTAYQPLADPIEKEMSKSPYEVTTDSSYKSGTYKDRTGQDVTLPQQKGFIPSTRRAFGYFIYDKYRRYMLKALEKLDPNACIALGGTANAAQIYEYQKFVRDYVSFMTPYRGVLVYHGLGSGKTCTAIAASEALLSSGGKKRIIVMTPFSLRKNFIQQITFCGFRHYRLLNYWISQEYKAADGKNALWLFATSVMKIPESYLSKRRGTPLRIWIPDLNKPQSEENYTKLASNEQQEIRNQIYETLVYDPDKKKDGLIWFISYNGMPASKLRDIACERPDAFDNAVIVIDEIHNLVRLMQGVIDPYLKRMFKGEVDAEVKSDPKYLDVEQITSEKWKPKYCKKTMNYKRGYLFYRLLLQAKNTKNVGLSGTPLINFPEELGILANILHGYNFTYTATLPKITEADGYKKLEKGLKDMAEGTDPANFCPDIDFYEVSIDDKSRTIQFMFTFLPEGYRKIQGQLGVERIPFTEKLETVEEKQKKVSDGITKILKTINSKLAYSGGFKERAEPLLPVMGEPTIPEQKTLDDSFKGRFVDSDGVSIVNEQILMKRLSGLISYYKGSRKDLMPEVKPEDDIVVRVPMSLEQQKKYIAVRLSEIDIEKQKEMSRRGAPVEAAGTRGDDVELKKLASSQNYRMASRQACNFTFPDGFTRPRPLTAKQIKEADEFGAQVDELLGDDQAQEPSALVQSAEEEQEATRIAREEAEKALAEEEEISGAQEEEEIKVKREELRGQAEGVIQAAVEAIRQRYEQERQGGVVLGKAEQPPEGLGEEQKRCLANILPGERYQAAINRAKNCLLTLGLPKLALQDPSDTSKSPLGRCSTKYKAILQNILALSGSSLVYSQFLGMEGIGIFTIAMQANGFVPIKIVSKEGQFVFDEQSEESIRKGPGAKENRFILFTGGEDENIRKINIDLFNAKFSELPSKLIEVLRSSGFTDEIGNKYGELCKVFCITAAGAEGLSLKNVRGVHIMEPYWNDVRMAQVKGRAVRICSHQELPLKERNVKIFTYISIFDPLAQEARGDASDAANQWAIPQDIWMRDSLPRATAESYGLVVSATKGEYAMTSDERLYFISERKKKLVENLVIVMKTAAADCLLNYKENRDGTFICRLLGNEGDFLYHPNLQRDIETSKHDEIGNMFVVPPAEVAKVKEAEAKLSFEEEKKEEETVIAPVGAETTQQEQAAVAETAQVLTAEATQPKVEAPPKPPAKPAEAAQEKRITYKVKISDKVYTVAAKPSELASAPQENKVFYIYEAADTQFATPKGTVKAQLKDGKWLPVGGTAKFT